VGLWTKVCVTNNKTHEKAHQQHTIKAEHHDTQ